MPRDPLQHLTAVCHLRHPFGRHKACDFNAGKPGRTQLVDQIDLIFCGDEAGLVLQPVPWSHLKDFNKFAHLYAS